MKRDRCPPFLLPVLSLSFSRLGREIVSAEHCLPYRGLITTTVPFFAVLLLIEGTGPGLKPLESRAAHARGQYANNSATRLSDQKRLRYFSLRPRARQCFIAIFYLTDDFPRCSNLFLLFVTRLLTKILDR